MQYYPIEENWQKLKLIYRSTEAKSIWYPDILHYWENRADYLGIKEKRIFNRSNLVPYDFETIDWVKQLNYSKHNQPEYFDYVVLQASPWLVKLNLYVALIAEPGQWQMVHNNAHSIVWDTEDVIFDPIGLALGMTADECYNMAFNINI